MNYVKPEIEEIKFATEPVSNNADTPSTLVEDPRGGE